MDIFLFWNLDSLHLRNLEDQNTHASQMKLKSPPSNRARPCLSSPPLYSNETKLQQPR
jgi:hypothetical protein